MKSKMEMAGDITSKVAVYTLVSVYTGILATVCIKQAVVNHKNANEAKEAALTAKAKSKTQLSRRWHQA